MKLPLDSSKVTRLCEYMVTGLAWLHWGADLTEPTQVRASFFHPTAIRALESLFLNERWGAKIEEDIGAGTMTYRAVQDSLAPSRTFWRFTLYGIVVGDAIGFPGVRADTIYGVSNPPQ